jgi:cardiolipin synthase
MRLLRLGGASARNRVALMFDGDETFSEIWRTIAGATKQAWVETYIIEPDRVGRRFIDELTAAARRGCEVMLIYDAVGGSRITEEFVAPLREAGGVVHVFNPVWRWRRLHPLLLRNHRKIIVVDGRVAFTGGRNLSEDYAGPRYGNGLFHDCHVRLEGPCVRDLARILVSSLSKKVDDNAVSAPRLENGTTFVQALASSGMIGRRAIQRAVRITVRHSMQRCWIATPYFLPPARLIRAINRAAARGVDVRIITAGRSDVPIVSRAAQHIYGLLMKRGVRIFEMHETTLHSKTLTMDGVFTMVGSFNLDAWSDKRNLEVMVGMLDAEIARTSQEQFERDLAASVEVTLATWQRRSLLKRAWHWLAYQLMRI